MWDKRMQMGWQWKKDQEEKKRREEEAKRQAAQAASVLARTESGASPVQLDPRFAQVEKQVHKLRQDLADRKIDEKKFQEKAGALMLEDQQGNWWMVGSESGVWYRYDSMGWTQATPPGGNASATPFPSSTTSTASPRRRESAIVRLWNAAFTFVFVIVFFGLAGFSLGEYMDQIERGQSALCFAGAVWLLGLWAAFRLARAQWRK